MKKVVTAISDILRNVESKRDERYAPLKAVLDMAFKRASEGKGEEHHSFGEPFVQQFILRGARRFGLGALQFQIAKKNEQIAKMPNVQDKINEFLDVINYAAAAVILLQERMQAENRRSN